MAPLHWHQSLNQSSEANGLTPNGPKTGSCFFFSKMRDVCFSLSKPKPPPTSPFPSNNLSMSGLMRTNRSSGAKSAVQAMSSARERGLYGGHFPLSNLFFEKMSRGRRADCGKLNQRRNEVCQPGPGRSGNMPFLPSRKAYLARIRTQSPRRSLSTGCKRTSRYPAEAI